MPSIVAGNSHSTRLEIVQEKLQQLASKSPDGRVITSGTDLAKETNLTLTQVHEAIFHLTRQGLIHKERRGSRYRPMIIRLADGNSSPSTAIPCPHCGKSLDLGDLIQVKLGQIEGEKKRLIDALSTLGTLEPRRKKG